jgi:hypothetical protein
MSRTDFLSLDKLNKIGYNAPVKGLRQVAPGWEDDATAPPPVLSRLRKRASGGKSQQGGRLRSGQKVFNWRLKQERILKNSTNDPRMSMKTKGCCGKVAAKQVCI